MPQIEISQEAHDLLVAEAHRWMAEAGSAESVEKVMTGLANDFLIHGCTPWTPEPDDPAIPF